MQMFMEANRRQYRTGCEAVAWWIVGRFGLWSVLQDQVLHLRHIADAAWAWSALAGIASAIAWVELRTACKRGLHRAPGSDRVHRHSAPHLHAAAA